MISSSNIVKQNWHLLLDQIETNTCDPILDLSNLMLNDPRLGANDPRIRELVSALKKNTTLNILDLSQNAIHGEALTQILNAIQRKSLVSLRLNANGISDLDTPILAKFIQNNPPLKIIDLSMNWLCSGYGLISEFATALEKNTNMIEISFSVAPYYQNNPSDLNKLVTLLRRNIQHHLQHEKNSNQLEQDRLTTLSLLKETLEKDMKKRKKTSQAIHAKLNPLMTASNNNQSSHIKNKENEESLEINALQKQISELQSKLASLEPIYQEFQKKQTIKNTPDELKECPNQLAFYESAYSNLTSMFRAIQVLSSGLVQSEPHTTEDKIKKVLKRSVNVIPLVGNAVRLGDACAKLTEVIHIGHFCETLLPDPVHHAITKLTKELFGSTQTEKLKHAAKNLNISIKSIAGEISRKLLRRYRDQISELTTDEAASLGEIATFHILNSIYDENSIDNGTPNNHYSFVDQCVDAVHLYASSKQNLLLNNDVSFKTTRPEKNQRWTANGILGLSGVKYHDQHEPYYYANTYMNPEKYGYRYLETVEELNYYYENDNDKQESDISCFSVVNSLAIFFRKSPPKNEETKLISPSKTHDKRL